MILTDLPLAAQAKIVRMMKGLPADWRPVVISEERSPTGATSTVELVDNDDNHAGVFVIWCDAAELVAPPNANPAKGE